MPLSAFRVRTGRGGVDGCWAQLGLPGLRWLGAGEGGLECIKHAWLLLGSSCLWGTGGQGATICSCPQTGRQSYAVHAAPRCAGETEEQFQRTVALVEEVGFDRVNTGALWLALWLLCTAAAGASGDRSSSSGVPMGKGRACAQAAGACARLRLLELCVCGACHRPAGFPAAWHLASASTSMPDPNAGGSPHPHTHARSAPPLPLHQRATTCPINANRERSATPPCRHHHHYHHHCMEAQASA